MEYDLYKIMGCVDVCIEFKLLKVKVPIIFLGVGMVLENSALAQIERTASLFHPLEVRNNVGCRSLNG